MSTSYNADLDGVIKGILAHTPNLTHEQTEALNKQIYEKLSRIIDERVQSRVTEMMDMFDERIAHFGETIRTWTDDRINQAFLEHSDGFNDLDEEKEID